MKITPLDIGNHRFPKKFRGYDPREVEIFLEMISQEMEELIQENRFLTEELKRKSADLAEIKEKESILKEAIITAQRLSDDMKAKMVKEAQAIVAHAELEADSIIKRARDQLIDIQSDIQEYREQRVRAREQVRSVLKTHLALLDAAELHDGREFEDSGSNLRVIQGR